MVTEERLSVICAEAQAGRMRYSRHFLIRLLERPQPTRDDIRYLLCDDDPAEIEENGPRYEQGSSSSLVWGILRDGRVAHVLCSHPPDPVIITSYWPDTEPEEWADNYRRRVTT